MSIEVEEIKTYRFSVDEYHRLGEAGILGEDDRIELLHGELVIMSPIGIRHNNAVSQLTEFFITRAQGRYQARSQCTLLVDDESELLPDLTLLRAPQQRYQDRHPQPADVLLVIEVADESLGYDRRSKGRAYAMAGISEFWIVNLRESALEVFRKPEGEHYTEKLRFDKNDRIAPLFAQSGELSFADVLP